MISPCGPNVKIEFSSLIQNDLVELLVGRITDWILRVNGLKRTEKRFGPSFYQLCIMYMVSFVGTILKGKAHSTLLVW